MADGLVQRVNARHRNQGKDEEEISQTKNYIDSNDEVKDKYKSKRLKLSLMEEILILSMKENTGETFLLTDTASYSIRACMLVELAMRGKIELEPMGLRKRSSERRNVIVINNSITGDPILDEALRIISESPESDSVKAWLDLLSGETWNLQNLKYQMKNVRTRICKGLSEKGICSTDVQDFVLFSVTTHPIIDESPKKNIIAYINELLTKNFVDVDSLSPRDFALISISYASKIIDNALACLSEKDYKIACTQLNKIGDLDPEKEIIKLQQMNNDEKKNELNVKEVIFSTLSAIYQIIFLLDF
ncbi:hypothetical protein HZS_2515 [Henneguya salminicola]|nr:hypothetical protein HZS_2515 [Henneguya salminicola]